jgi:hypothetical protein
MTTCIEEISKATACESIRVKSRAVLGLCLLLGVSATSRVSAETVWLDDLDLSHINQGWGKAQKNKCAAKNPEDGKPLTIAAKRFERASARSRKA